MRNKLVLVVFATVKIKQPAVNIIPPKVSAEDGTYDKNVNEEKTVIQIQPEAFQINSGNYL